MEKVREEIPVFGLWWIWVMSAIGYCLLDCFLRRILVRSCLNHYYRLYKPDRKESKVQSLPGYSNAVITERIITALTAVAVSSVGVVILYETREDCLKARSSLVLPSAYVFSWNFIHDLYCMFKRFKLSRVEYCNISTSHLMLKFVQLQFIFILHHTFLFTLGLVVAHYPVRKGLGDFMFGCVYIMEFTNPFISVHFILKELQLRDTLCFKINGVLAIIVHFITRILVVPFTYIIYAYQYHDGAIVPALQTMRPICHTVTVAGFSLQLYWFILMIKQFLASAAKILSKRKQY